MTGEKREREPDAARCACAIKSVQYALALSLSILSACLPVDSVWCLLTVCLCWNSYFFFFFFYHRFEIPKFNSGWYAMQCYAIFNVLCCCCCCAARTTMSFCLECVLWVRLQTLLTARICSNMLSIFRMHCIYAYRPIYAMSALVERGPSASQIRMPGVLLFNFSITTSMISIWLHAVGH